MQSEMSHKITCWAPSSVLYTSFNCRLENRHPYVDVVKYIVDIGQANGVRRIDRNRSEKMCGEVLYAAIKVFPSFTIISEDIEKLYVFSSF